MIIIVRRPTCYLLVPFRILQSAIANLIPVQYLVLTALRITLCDLGQWELTKQNILHVAAIVNVTSGGKVSGSSLSVSQGPKRSTRHSIVCVF